MHAHAGGRPGHGTVTRASRGRRHRFPGRDRFHRDRLDHQRTAGHQEAELPAIGLLEARAHVGHGPRLDHPSGVGALVLQVCAALDADAIGRHALRQQFAARGDRETL